MQCAAAHRARDCVAVPPSENSRLAGTSIRTASVGNNAGAGTDAGIAGSIGIELCGAGAAISAEAKPLRAGAGKYLAILLGIAAALLAMKAADSQLPTKTDKCGGDRCRPR